MRVESAVEAQPTRHRGGMCLIAESIDSLNIQVNRLFTQRRDSRVDRLRDKAHATTVPIGLGFNRRFDPHFAAVRSRVLAGDIGNLEQLLITSRDSAPASTEYLAVSGGVF